MAKPKGEPLAANDLFAEIITLIDEARGRAFVAVNAELTLLYWRVGQRIHKNVLQEKRADYGQQVISSLAQQLTRVYGSGWGEKQLRHCLQFAEVFPGEAIVYTVCRQLGWSKLRMLMYIDEPLKRDFYLELAKLENWSVRQLRERINSQLFERTALSRQGEDTIRHDLERLRKEGEVSSNLILKDPYLLHFLGLEDRYLEKDLEDAILRELENFLLELGAGFSFVARQKRIQIDRDDYFIDLLLYNRKLKRLVAIDLKIGEFEAGFKGQMELYLRWLAKYEQEPDEASPLGIILCTGKKEEHIELLELGQSDIHVAEYLTVLPSKKLLKAKLQAALAQAQERLEARADDDRE
jgi:predicted nuclease of restriction endonuclease-like (RecB) superfamily